MNRLFRHGLAFCGLLSALATVPGCRRSHPSVDAAEEHRPPRVWPDYSDTVVPPNIAPLNFRVEEPGRCCHATIAATYGPAIEVRSTTRTVSIPAKPWADLLAANRGGELRVTVAVEGPDGQWTRYEPITNRVAREPVDDYLVFRWMTPICNWWRDLGVHERRLSSFGRRLVLHGRQFGDGCLNCHTFLGNDTQQMALGIRSRRYGSSTLITSAAEVVKVKTRFGYTSWHPQGRMVVFSVNKVRQFFHPAGDELRDVLDLESGLAYYDLSSQSVKTVPQIAHTDQMETYPCWSPDGRTLYFSRAPIPWSDRETVPPTGYDQVRYSLMRIRYDPSTDAWGEAETLASADKTGRSMVMPRVSPDGRYIMFCACRYGCFPIHQPTSDLWVLDLETGRHRELTVNSERSESWHSWSANGRWFVFSSKRQDGLFAKPYLSYFDQQGKAHKPLLLPQRDPGLYDCLHRSYNVPELVTEPVRMSRFALGRAVRASGGIEVEMPPPFGKSGPGGAPDQTEPWKPSVRQ